MLRDKKYKIQEFIISIVLTMSSLMLIFSFTDNFGIEKSKYYTVAFIFVLLLFVVERVGYIHRYNLEFKRFRYEESFKKKLYGLLVELKSSDMSEGEMYNRVLSDAMEVIRNCDAGTITMLGEDGIMEYEAVFGFDKNILSRVEMKLEDTYLYRTTEGKLDRPIIVDNSGVAFEKEAKEYLADFSSNLEDEGIVFDGMVKVNFDEMKTSLIAPIMVNGKVVGSLNLDSKTRFAFSEEDKMKAQFLAFNVGDALEAYMYNKNYSNLTKYDQMTRVYNREYFKSLHEEIHNKGDVISYIYTNFDINGLTKINEKYGRDAGDKVIIGFVEVVKKIIPETAILGRYSGDEFNCIFVNLNKELCKTMFRTIADYLELNGIEVGEKRINVSFTYGMAIYPNNSKDLDEIVMIAEHDRKNSRLGV